MDLGKLLPLAFKLLGQADKIKRVISETDPVVDELRKVWPEAAPLIRDIRERSITLYCIMTPAVREAVKAWPEAQPIVTDLANQVWPELVAQWGKAHESTLPQFSVRWLQENLNVLGASPRVPVDGEIGPVTHRAIKAFQQKAGVQADGWAGPETLTAMLKALAK